MSDSQKKPKVFKNPLLQSTESGLTEEALPTLSPLNDESIVDRKQQSKLLTLSSLGSLNSFEQRHVRMTNWVDRSLKARLDNLCLQQGRGSRSRLINEAIADLLRKYKAT